jgi:hypothetical protein
LQGSADELGSAIGVSVRELARDRFHRAGEEGQRRVGLVISALVAKSDELAMGLFQVGQRAIGARNSHSMLGAGYGEICGAFDGVYPMQRACIARHARHGGRVDESKPGHQEHDEGGRDRGHDGAATRRGAVLHHIGHRQIYRKYLADTP